MMRMLCAAFLLAAVLPAQTVDLLALQHGAERKARDRLYHALFGIKLQSVDLIEATPKELASYLSMASGNTVNFVVSTKKEISPITLRLRRVPLTTVMAVARDSSDLRFVYSSGLVLLQHKEEVKEYASLRIYDVRHAVAKIRNVAAPKLGLGRGEGDEDAGEEEESETTLSGFTLDRLLDLVRSHAMPDSWDRDGISISASHGVLVVRQTDRGHRAVRSVLRALGVITPLRRVVRRRTTRGPLTPKKAVAKKKRKNTPARKPRRR